MLRLSGPIFFSNANSIRVIEAHKQTFLNPRYIESVAVKKDEPTQTVRVVFITTNDGKYEFISNVIPDPEGKYSTFGDAYDSLAGHIHGMFR